MATNEDTNRENIKTDQRISSNQDSQTGGRRETAEELKARMMSGDGGSNTRRRSSQDSRERLAPNEDTNREDIKTDQRISSNQDSQRGGRRDTVEELKARMMSGDGGSDTRRRSSQDSRERLAPNKDTNREDINIKNEYPRLGVEGEQNDQVLFDHENPFLNRSPVEEAETPLPAEVVSDETDGVLRSSIVVKTTLDKKKKMLRWLAMAICLSIILIVSIAVPLSTRSVKQEYKTNFPSDIPTSNPTFTPSMAPSTFAFSQRKNVMQEYLESISDKAALMDPSSPQGKAFEWIYEEDMTPMDEDNFIQRYVLAVFYYSTGGDDWAHCYKGDIACSTFKVYKVNVIKSTYLSKDNECDWFGNECVEGNITELKLAFNVDGIIQGNNLQGRIPSEISKLTGLHLIYMYRNKITGTLPESIGELQSLRRIYLDYNNIVSPLPESFFTLQQLQVAQFGTNLLDGQITPQFANMSKLTVLNLHENNFSGTIPPELGKLTNLETLNLYSNQLESTIPEEIYDALELQSIDFYDNRLSGTISSKIGNLQGLRKYAIDNNVMSGPIPSEMGNLPLLSRIILSDNRLTGTIPKELGDIEYPETFKFHYNDLNGTMPGSICNLKRIRASYDFETLTADCAGTPPKVSCRCCSSCY